MSHELDTSSGKAAIAYKGEMPWHGLGSKLEPGATIEQWQKAAGMNWNVLDRDVFTTAPVMRKGTGPIEESISVPNTKALIRDDNHFVLSTVSDRYKVVQPKEVIEFFRDLAEVNHVELETAGCLRMGRRFWALAKTTDSGVIGKNDRMEGYVLIATSVDGSMGTRVQHTAVRVVCANTLAIAMGSARSFVSVRHSRAFDAKAVKIDLGLAHESFGSFIEDAQRLAKVKVDDDKAKAFFAELYDQDVERVQFETLDTKASQLFHTFKNGIGQDLVTASGTAWGLVNAVTRFYDHDRETRTADSRLNRAWFGDGSRLKSTAWKNALAI